MDFERARTVTNFMIPYRVRVQSKRDQDHVRGVEMKKVREFKYWEKLFVSIMVWKGIYKRKQ